MNKEVKTLWLNALRSGEYKQASSALKTSYGFCCLGVLCDLYRLQHPGSCSWELDKFDYVFKTGNGGGSGAFLPEVVRKWAELESCSPVANTNQTLVSLNDNYKKSFEEIANVIEESL